MSDSDESRLINLIELDSSTHEASTAQRRQPLVPSVRMQRGKQLTRVRFQTGSGTYNLQRITHMILYTSRAGPAGCPAPRELPSPTPLHSTLRRALRRAPHARDVFAIAARISLAPWRSSTSSAAVASIFS